MLCEDAIQYRDNGWLMSWYTSAWAGLKTELSVEVMYARNDDSANAVSDTGSPSMRLPARPRPPRGETARKMEADPPPPLPAFPPPLASSSSSATCGIEAASGSGGLPIRGGTAETTAVFSSMLGTLAVAGICLRFGEKAPAWGIAAGKHGGRRVRRTATR